MTPQVRDHPVLEYDWKAFLSVRGISVPAGVFVPYPVDKQRLIEAATTLRPPLVLKALGSSIIHKSEAGAVRVGLPTIAAVADAAATMLAHLDAHGPLPITGLLVEEMVLAGIELLLGLRSDSTFGRLVVFGVGGLMVEGLGEARFFSLPLRRFDIATVLGTLPWLDRTLARSGGVGVDALTKCLWAFGGPEGIALDPRIEEVEINPLIVGAHGATAVDVRGRMAPEA